MFALRKLLLGIPIAFAVPCLWAAPSMAGEYYVYACSSYGNTAPAFQSGTNADHLTPANECMQPAPGGGYRSLELNNPGPSAPVLHGYGANWTAYSPSPAIAIVGAYTPPNTVFVDCVLHSDGFAADYIWSSGTQAIDYINDCDSTYGYGYGTGINASFAPSPYFSWSAGCWLKSSCSTSSSVGAVLGVQGIRLTAEENTGPALLAVPNSNLWYATGWVRGSWPITLDASDPSGVCTMATVVDGTAVAGWSDPSPNTSSFTQCDGSQLPGQLNTTSYADGQHTVTYEASNAAGVGAAPSKTIYIDNAPVTLNLTGPTDAPSTAGTQYVDAYAGAGPSGVAAIFCSVDDAPYQRYGGSAAEVPVSGVGPHQVTCYATNNAFDASGAPATSPTQTWDLTIREPTVSAISFDKIVDALRCHRVLERVEVPARWVTVRRHHKLVRVRRRGHEKTVRATRCHARTARRREVVWKTVQRHGKTVRIKQIKVVRIVVLPHVVGHTTRRVPFGRGTTVSGWLGLYNGTALAGQSVRLLAAPDNGSNDFRQVALVTTRSDGSWIARLPRGPERLVVAVYDGSSTTEPASSPPVRVIVPAKVRLKIRPTVTHWGATIRIIGRVLGGYIPVGKFLRLRDRCCGSQGDGRHPQRKTGRPLPHDLDVRTWDRGRPLLVLGFDAPRSRLSVHACVLAAGDRHGRARLIYAVLPLTLVSNMKRSLER